MSKKSVVHPSTVIEWSPKRVAVFDPSTRTSRAFENTREAANAIGSQPVVVAVSRRAVFVRTMRVPNTSASEIETIVRMRLGELFPIPAHELAFAVDLTDDIDKEGRLAVIVAMPAGELRKLREDMKEAGFRIHSVVPIAYGSVVLASTLSLTSGAIASKDENGVGIDIVQDGILRYSRVAPLTGAIASEVCRTYSVAGIECGEIVVAEGLNVQDADTVTAISPLEALSGAWPSYIPSLELPETVALNLTKRRNARMRMAAFVLLAGIAFAAVTYLDYMNNLQSVEQAKARMDRSVAAMKEQAELARAEADKAAAVEAGLKRGFMPGQPLSDVVMVVANRVPEGVWLSGVSVERGKQIALRGTARTSESVAEYLRNIQAADAPVLNGEAGEMQPRFRDVKLVMQNTAKIDDTTVVQFSITATPVGNIPIADATGATAR